jgi:hypothetical protein
MDDFTLNKETGIEGNLPTWPGASAVYSKAYRLMKKYGPDHNLIDALNDGDEEIIKADMLRINLNILTQRQKL